MTPLIMQGLGYVLLVLGVVGLFLPILQGVLFTVAGLLILSRYATWAQDTLAWIKRRHPTVERVIGKSEALADRWTGRLNSWLERRFG